MRSGSLCLLRGEQTEMPVLSMSIFSMGSVTGTCYFLFTHTCARTLAHSHRNTLFSFASLFRNPHPSHQHTSHQVLSTPESALIRTLKVCVWHHQSQHPNNAHPDSAGGSQQVLRLNSLLGGRTPGQPVGYEFYLAILQILKSKCNF